MMERKINLWLAKLSSTLGQKTWQLDNNQCCLNDDSGSSYLVMEWLPECGLLLLAFPLSNSFYNEFKSDEIMLELLLPNVDTGLTINAWLAISEQGKQYFLMSTIDLIFNSYEAFEQQWLQINELTKMIQFFIKTKMHMSHKLMTEQTVRV